MDDKIDKVREAIETLCEALELALARLGVCGQGDGSDHKADADSIGGTNALTMGRAALAALSAIDPEAIRREEHKRCIALVEKNRVSIPVILAQVAYNTAIDDCISILSAEPAQDDGKPGAFASAIVKELRVNWAFDTDDALSVLNGAERRVEEAKE